MNRPTLLAVRVLTILLIAVGVIWILRGINVLPGSFMTAQIQWAYRGGIAAVVGASFVDRPGERRKRHRSATTGNPDKVSVDKVSVTDGKWIHSLARACSSG